MSPGPSARKNDQKIDALQRKMAILYEFPQLLAENGGLLG
jgi:hypothetical protein